MPVHSAPPWISRARGFRLALLVSLLCLLPYSAVHAQYGYEAVTGLPLNAWITVAGVATAPDRKSVV